MKKVILTILILNGMCAFASNSMFDDNGTYSGNWKQMTNVSSSSKARSYSSSSWYNNHATNGSRTGASPAQNSGVQTLPYRYNTLNYTRIRKVKGGWGDYSAKCTDIGDTSFCQ